MMAKIEDLRKLDLSKVPDEYKDLADGVKQLIDDYDKESDKTFFEKEAQGNIDAYLDMVNRIVPGAIEEKKADSKNKTESNRGKEKEEDLYPKIKGKNRKILFQYDNALTDLAIDYEGEESQALKNMFEVTLNGMRVIPEQADDETIPSLVPMMVQAIYNYKDTFAVSQIYHHGKVNEVDFKILREGSSDSQFTFG